MTENRNIKKLKKRRSEFKFEFRQKWKMITSVLSVIVIVGTVGSLMLPAITWNGLYCEMLEHAHDTGCYLVETERVFKNESCGYDDPLIHTHDALCYSVSGELICAISELSEHEHDENCYTAETVIDEGHAHDDSCYDMILGTEIVCETVETEGHTHDESCYESAESAVHTHGDGCYASEKTELICAEAEREPVTEEHEVLICGKEETEGHTHVDACFNENKEILCMVDEMPAHYHDETCYKTEHTVIDAGHSHNDTCWKWATVTVCGLEEGEAEADAEAEENADSEKTLICGKDEIAAHTHGDGCYARVRGDLICTEEEREPSETEGETKLTCGKDEVIFHIHDELCYMGDALICGKTEQRSHQHTEECFDETENKELICELPEHIHTEECDRIDDSQAEIADVIMLIAAIPDIETIELNLSVKTGDEYTAYKEKTVAQINGALDAYNALSDEQKPLVSNYRRLTEYAYFITDDPDVKDILIEINGLPTLAEFEEKYDSFSSIYKPVYVQDISEQIDWINTLYDALSEDQREAVLSYYRVTELQLRLNALIPSDDSLEFTADGYKTIVSADSEAELPSDTVITSRPIFDSGSGVSAVYETSDGEVRSYEDDIENAVSWGYVTDIKLYDITLTSDDGEVQPKAPVDVTTEFTEPLALGSGEVIYAVHFGDSGVELLPAYTERDEYGNIISVTHTQTSFSVTGYVLVHVSNPYDIGPDILPVHYCIWVNDQWIIAGSSRTGWYGGYNPREEWPPEDDQRDYITVDQMMSVLGDYGLSDNLNLDGVLTDAERTYFTETIWYQRAEDSGMTIRHDTVPTQKNINGEMKWVFLLSGNKVKDDGYHVYYVPEGTVSGKESDPSTTYERNRVLGADLKQASKFYSMTVRDMNQIVYDKNSQDLIPSVQYILYGHPVEVTVKANGTQGWQWVNDKGEVVHGISRMYDENKNGIFEDDGPDERFGYVDNGDGTETYSFSGILGRTTLIPYSVAADGANQTTDKQVDIAVFLDGEWQKVGQLNLMYKQANICVGDDGITRWYITAGQIYSILQPFGFIDPVGDDSILLEGFTFCHINEAFSETAVNNTKLLAAGVKQNLGSTIAVGFGFDDIKNYTLFYIPAENNGTKEEIEAHTAKSYSESALFVGNGFYSLKVKDDYQLVYYGHETDAFNVYVPEGEGVTVSVENALSVLWSVREPWETERPNDYVASVFTVKTDDNFNTFKFTAVNSPILIEASSLNPHFTVQYYADIVTYNLYDTAGANTLEIIDTTGKRLPENSTNNPLIYLQLDKTNVMSTENNGKNDYMYEVHQEKISQAIYNEKSFQYDKSHLWKNVDKLWNNSSYEILRIGILKDGRDPESQEVDDWWVYNCRDNGANITFTNIASEENAPHKDGQDIMPADKDYTLLITEGMIIRLHYNLVTDETVINNVEFFDYDITNGKVTYDSGIEGINARSNFPGTNFGGGGTNIQNIYAFGNRNCGTGLATATMNGGVWINQANSEGNEGVITTKACAFGLVGKKLDANGNLVWNVNAPDIFNEDPDDPNTVGRHDYVGNLTFKKWGDVYVLSKADSTAGTRTNLEYLFNPSPTTGTVHTHIFTNDFWVVDKATTQNRSDPLWGKYNADVSYKSRLNTPAKDTLGDRGTNGEGYSGNFPVSDDGKAHNSFFGMKFSIDFSISEDYIGPLSYVFFGDDDMWVYLDDTLVCDIGGVHTSVGQYVDLREYLPIGGAETEGHHTLTFYYTERGSSGSTCWMSFTLPSVTSSIVEEGTSEIIIEKTAVDPAGDEIVSNEEYEFTVEIFKDSTKEVAINTAFSLVIETAEGDEEYYSVETGQSILIGSGDKATIYGVPIGSWYVITEKEDIRFNVEANGQEGRVVQGTTVTLNLATFKNVLKGYAILPDTGGGGTQPYIFSGLSATTVACALMYIKTRKKRKEAKR